MGANSEQEYFTVVLLGMAERQCRYLHSVCLFYPFSCFLIKQEIRPWNVTLNYTAWSISKCTDVISFTLWGLNTPFILQKWWFSWRKCAKEQFLCFAFLRPHFLFYLSNLHFSKELLSSSQNALVWAVVIWHMMFSKSIAVCMCFHSTPFKGFTVQINIVLHIP